MTIHHCAPGWVLTQALDKSGAFTTVGAIGTDQYFAKVLTVGESFHSEFGAVIEAPCTAGDTIIWTGNLPIFVVRDGQEYRLIKFTEVAAVVEEA